MNRIARQLIIFCYFLFLSMLTACSQPGSQAIRFGLASAPISLDPRFATDASSVRINRLLYQRLVDFDDQYRPVPSLASWKKISDTHYRFTLNKTARKFTNGYMLQAADVKATYDFILDKSNASPHRGSLNKISRIDVIDNKTIDFILNQSDPLFPGYLVIGIVPEKAIKQGLSLDKKPQGSGAFRFVSWLGQGRLNIERKSDKQQVAFLHVQDPTVRVLKLIRGEVDVIQNDLPVELVRYLTKKKTLQTKYLEGSNFTYLGFNMQHPDLKKRLVRQAIAHAINRKELVRYMMESQTKLATGLLPPYHWAGIQTENPYDYNPEKARRLLAQAGYSARHPLKLEYKTSGNPLQIRIATIIQQQLKDAGIKLKLRSLDWATVYGDIKSGRFQLYSLSWVGIKLPDIFYYVFHSKSVPPAGANRGRYNNVKVDKLLELADKESDMQQRIGHYQQLQDLLLKDLPYIPLWYKANVAIMSSDIKDYRLAKDGNYDGLEFIRKGGS